LAYRDNVGAAVIVSIVPTTVIVAWMAVLGVDTEILGLAGVTLFFVISGLFVVLDR